jgi:hypothetical protein
MANIGTELADILHRIIHSSSAAEVEKIALHDAVNAIDPEAIKAQEAAKAEEEAKAPAPVETPAPLGTGIPEIDYEKLAAAIAAATAPPPAPVDPPEATLIPEATTAKESE